MSVQEAFEQFRKATRGDMRGKELAAFARLDGAVKAAAEEPPAAFPDVWCDTCNRIRPMIFGIMRAGRLNDHDAADLLCSECHFIVATLHARRKTCAVNPSKER